MKPMNLHGVEYAKEAEDLFVYRQDITRTVWANPTKSRYILHDTHYNEGAHEVWSYVLAVANTWWVISATSLGVLEESAVRSAQVLINPPVDSQGFLVFDRLDLSGAAIIGFVFSR